LFGKSKLILIIFLPVKLITVLVPNFFLSKSDPIWALMVPFGAQFPKLDRFWISQKNPPPGSLNQQTTLETISYIVGLLILHIQFWFSHSELMGLCPVTSKSNGQFRQLSPTKLGAYAFSQKYKIRQIPPLFFVNIGNRNFMGSENKGYRYFFHLNYFPLQRAAK